MRTLFGTLRLALAVAVFAAGGAAWAQGNLLAGKSPSSESGVRRSEVLTDGRAGQEGDFWRTGATAHFESGSAFVVYDLGAPSPVVAGWLQGDNNDVYVVEVSADGSTWQPVWKRAPRPRPACAPATATEMAAPGQPFRYVRISARDGDGAFSLSEVQLFAQVPPGSRPPSPGSRAPRPSSGRATQSCCSGLALVLLVLLSYRGARRGLDGAAGAADGGGRRVVPARLPRRGSRSTPARWGWRAAMIALVALVADPARVFPAGAFPAHRTRRARHLSA